MLSYKLLSFLIGYNKSKIVRQKYIILSCIAKTVLAEDKTSIYQFKNTSD